MKTTLACETKIIITWQSKNIPCIFQISNIWFWLWRCKESVASWYIFWMQKLRILLIIGPRVGNSRNIFSAQNILQAYKLTSNFILLIESARKRNSLIFPAENKKRRHHLNIGFRFLVPEIVRWIVVLLTFRNVWNLH